MMFHDDVFLSFPLKGTERNILQLLPVSEMLYSTDLTHSVSELVPELEHHLSWMESTTGNSKLAWIALTSSIMSSWVIFPRIK